MRRDNENRRDFTARPSRERDDRDPCLRRSIQKNRAIHIDAIYYCFAPIMNLSDYYKFYGPQMRPRGIAERLVLSSHLIVFLTRQHLYLTLSLADTLIAT